MNWKPIETAPKDGTPVDLWVIETANNSNGQPKEYRVPDCWYNQGKWHASDTWLGQAIDSLPGIIVTHWMSIPDGPKGTAEVGSYAWRPDVDPPATEKTLRSTVTYTSSRSD